MTASDPELPLSGPPETSPITRSGLRSWRLAVFVSCAPVLAVALGASTIADRLVFLGWGVLATLATVGALRRASTRGLAFGRLLSAGLLAQGVSYALFALLLLRYGEALALGWRALSWSGWRTVWVATPAPWLGLALVVLATGVVLRGR